MTRKYKLDNEEQALLNALAQSEIKADKISQRNKKNVNNFC